MIEIKNKRMILFREDRLIGAMGDVDTSHRKFILNAVQDGCDLTEMVAWIKIDPNFPGESPYDQLLDSEIVGDKIILTWRLTAKNLQREGEISAQIIFASPDYFNEQDLAGIHGGSLILPEKVEGVSAPVWQSYPETFVIEESIEATAGYQELEKNVLMAAVSEAISSARNASAAAEAAIGAQEYTMMLSNDAENARNSVEGCHQAILIAQKEVEENLEAVRECAEIAREKSVDSADAATLSENYQVSAQYYAEQALKEANKAQEYYNEVVTAKEACLDNAEYSYEQAQKAKASAQNALEAENGALQTLAAVKRARDFRLIYSKTLTAEDTDCYSFEITQDVEGNKLLLSEFTIFLYIPQVSSTTGTYLQVRICPHDANGYGIITQYIGTDKTKDVYQRIECANRGRWRANIVRGNAWNQNGDVVYHTGSVCSTSRFTDGKSASAILVQGGTPTSVLFPEGTTIEVWGVDAIKEAE